MKALRMKRLHLATQDVDCCPAVIGQLTENCLGALKADLDKEMLSLGGHFHSTQSFWTAVLHILGWNPSPRTIERFPDDVRSALTVCATLRKQLERKAPLFPSRALVEILRQAAEDYGNAAKRWGVDITIEPPANPRPRARSFEALCITYSSKAFTEPRTCKIGLAHPAGRQLAHRFEHLRTDQHKVFIIEILAPSRPMRLPAPATPLLTTA